MEGWIKLYRQITENFLWNSKKEPFDHRSAFIDLLLDANHKDKKIFWENKTVVVKCGQTITSIRKLAERWHWGVNRVRKYLDLLESENMVTRESTNKYTVLSIVNYQKYQGFEGIEHTQADTQTDTQMDTLTDTQTDTDQIRRRITNKNIKNDKNEKKNIYGEYQHVKLTPEELQKLNEAYGEEMTRQCITYLDEYIEMKGYKAKSHYLCIKKWVVDAVKEKKPKKTDSTFCNIESDESMDYLMELLKKGG